MVGKGLPWKGLSVHQVLQDNDSYTTRAKNVYTNVQTSRVSVSIQICAKSGMRVTTLKEFCQTALQSLQSSPLCTTIGIDDTTNHASTWTESEE